MIDSALPLTRSLADLAVKSLSQVSTGALGQAAERHQPDGYRKLQIGYPLPVVAGASIA